MRSRKERRTEKAQALRNEKKGRRDIDRHFIDLKATMANVSHPAFREEIMKMNKEEFADFLTLFDKKNTTEEMTDG